MDKSESSRCGVVCIVGRPSTGKSTLMNTLLGEKVAIVSPVPQTTRYQVRGVLTEKRGQIVFLDTPGIYLSRNKLGRHMLSDIDSAIEGADVIIHLVDACERPGREEGMIIDKLNGMKAPIILAMNKVDRKAPYLDGYIKEWEKARGLAVTEMAGKFVLMPVSGMTGINTRELIDAIFELLPEAPMLYPPEVLTDFPQKLAIADILREKFFLLLKDEIPHSLAVYVEEMAQRPGKVMFISAVILVERDSQKSIVIGKGGSVLKKAGEMARVELETLLDKTVFLQTHVKVRAGWQDDPYTLKDLGY
jgi:GTP-binding protein Era